MINSDRSFVHAIRKYCDSRGIKVEIKSHGWLVLMQSGDRRRFAFGYDLGLNSSVAHRIMNDKAATSDVLTSCGVPCVQHQLFLSPKLYRYIKPSGTWQEMIRFLKASPEGIVVKPNEGTGGNSVFKVTTESELEIAVHNIFSFENSLVVSPYIEIEDEIRVILVDYDPIVVYRKERPSIVGDGKRTCLELAAATLSPERLLKILSDLNQVGENTVLQRVPAAGEHLVLNWRHNLGGGAQPVLLSDGPTRDACVQLAQQAARSIGVRFGSVDIVRTDEAWTVLEINSGVMMEALSEHHPELVEATYYAALDRVFG